MKISNMSRRIIGGDLPFVKQENPESPCTLSDRQICTFRKENEVMKKFLAAKGYQVQESILINAMMELLGVKTQAEIWESGEFKNFVRKYNIDPDMVAETYFKPSGPANNTDLLDNHNIDTVLNQWSRISLEKESPFGKMKFKNLGFHMIDFQLYDTVMASFKISDLLNENRFNCFGVVMNTDISSGRGKHWFCIFGDLTHAGTSEDPFTIEYFNSSGNPPMMEITVWFAKLIMDLKQKTCKIAESVNAAYRTLQYSKTECGMFSLMYIKSRLLGHPPKWYAERDANDKDMIELRARIFRT